MKPNLHSFPLLLSAIAWYITVMLYSRFAISHLS